jgi:squalene monooxygenase
MTPKNEKSIRAMTPSPDIRAERRTKYHEAEVVVVGAGIFGCAIAYALARQGRSVLLLERWMNEPDRIVGELLQPGGVAALRKLGLAHCLEGIDAIPCYGYDVVYRGNEVVIPYPEVDEAGRVRYRKNQLDGAAVRIPRESEGRSFHHGRFIMQLRKACLQQENITVVETDVQKTMRGEHTEQVLGVESRTTNKATGEKTTEYFFGQLTIVADGYKSKFREEYLKSKPIVRSKFYALELIDCPLPYRSFGHVIIGDAYPVLLYHIGTH